MMRLAPHVAGAPTRKNMTSSTTSSAGGDANSRSRKRVAVTMKVEIATQYTVRPTIMRSSCGISVRMTLTAWMLRRAPSLSRGPGGKGGPTRGLSQNTPHIMRVIPTPPPNRMAMRIPVLSLGSSVSRRETRMANWKHSAISWPARKDALATSAIRPLTASNRWLRATVTLSSASAPPAPPPSSPVPPAAPCPLDLGLAAAAAAAASKSRSS
mmetsp:Transcript_71550/g.225970  ORF Transcript_71550/g.225970 Transcript_71550/m.225970 type:complete len:212 (-) Transcript_71550:690-1325(-)